MCWGKGRENYTFVIFCMLVPAKKSRSNVKFMHLLDLKERYKI